VAEELHKEDIMEKRIGTRKCFILSVALICLLWVGNSQAQDYPKSPIQIVIPFGPGGLTDIFWRSTSDFIANNIKGTIVLVNKPGAGGVVGTSFAVNAKPDGYTLVSANSDPLTISPVFTPNVPYDPEKDITYVAKLAAMAFGIAVLNESPFKTLEELVAFAKANPKKLKSGVMGVGSTPHTILEVFNRDAKIDISYVPFDSGGETVTNLLGGHTDLAVVSLPSIKSQVLAGKARILAVCSPKRLPDFPELPTMGEKGYKKSSIATGVGLAGPKGLASAIVSKWEEAIEKTLKDPKVIAIIEKLGGVVVDFKSGEDYKKELIADLATFREIVPTLPGKK
jgi:tripartite-type tricarboxylate transporter receptor subunit TctC